MVDFAFVFLQSSYDSLIASVWPEFGGNGKSSLRLVDVLRHEAGLASLDASIPIEDLTIDRIKKNAVGQVIERQRPQ